MNERNGTGKRSWDRERDNRDDWVSKRRGDCCVIIIAAWQMWQKQLQQQQEQRDANEKNNQQINKMLTRAKAIMIANRKERRRQQRHDVTHSGRRSGSTNGVQNGSCQSGIATIAAAAASVCRRWRLLAYITKNSCSWAATCNNNSNS